MPSPTADACADNGAFVGAALAGDTGAVLVKQVLLPLHPAAAAAAAAAVVVAYLRDTVLCDPSHPLDKVTGIWPTLTARKYSQLSGKYGQG